MLTVITWMLWATDILSKVSQVSLYAIPKFRIKSDPLYGIIFKGINHEIAPGTLPNPIYPCT